MKSIYGFEVCVAACCREWLLPIDVPWGKCGYCGQVLMFVRDDGPIPLYPDSDFDKYRAAA